MCRQTQMMDSSDLSTLYFQYLSEHLFPCVSGVPITGLDEEELTRHESLFYSQGPIDGLLAGKGRGTGTRRSCCNHDKAYMDLDVWEKLLNLIALSITSNHDANFVVTGGTGRLSLRQPPVPPVMKKLES